MDFIFIHIPKTGGESVWKALGKRKEHVRAIDWKNDTFKFCFVRNPWTRLASLYKYRCRNPGMYWGIDPFIKKGFESWITEWSAKEPFVKGRAEGTRPQWDWISDGEKIIVDFIGRFENLEEDWKKVSSTLSINTPLPHLNKSANTKPIHTKETIQIISNYCKKEIELFEYEPPSLV